MNKEIFIVRHGRTDYNRRGVWQGSGIDASLDEIGKQQSQSFFECYQSQAFDLIVHSPLLRARQTVEPFRNLGIETVIKPEIREISWGIYEGRPHSYESLLEYRNVLDEWSNGNLDIGLQGGETGFELAARSRKFVDWLSEVNAKCILVCSHGRAIRALLCTMLNEEFSQMEKYEHHNTGVFKAKLEDGKYAFHFLNNIEHLEVEQELL